MNKLFIKKIMKSNQLFNMASTLFTAAFLTVFSSSALANRPAMDEPNAATNAATSTTETSSPTEATDLQPRPTAAEIEADAATNAPSAVEVMMQQQNQQPGQTTGSLQLPAKEMQPGETLSIQLVDFPRRGMSMERVQQEYGQPLSTSESVGQPPITHWIYNDRIVYFEYATVLHVVAR